MDDLCELLGVTAQGAEQLEQAILEQVCGACPGLHGNHQT